VKMVTALTNSCSKGRDAKKSTTRVWGLGKAERAECSPNRPDQVTRTVVGATQHLTPRRVIESSQRRAFENDAQPV